MVGFWERFLKSETIIIYPHDGWLSATYKTIEQVMLCITPSDLSRHSMFWQDFCLLKEPREIGNYSTGCKSPNHTFLKINILKESLLIVIQTIPQQKALDLSFNLAPWKWAWHYQEAATPSRREKHILLNFTAARRVFDFLISMTSLEVNFKDTKVFRASFES